MVIYPPSPPTFLYSREWAVKGAAHRRFRRLALDGLPRLCYFPGKRRGYILPVSYTHLDVYKRQHHMRKTETALSPTAYIGLHQNLK